MNNTFRLSDDSDFMPIIPINENDADNDKDLSIPPGTISFEYNPKAKEDDALINFIVQQTRKMKPLASADLESYLTLASQFLNIGKPFKIDGIGTLEKIQSGEITFLQEGQLLSALKEVVQVYRKEKSGEDISFTSKNKKSNNNNSKKIIVTIGVLLVITGIVAAAWYFLNNKKDTEQRIQNVTADSPIQINNTADSIKKDSLLRISITPAAASATSPTTGITFKIIFKVTNNKAAAIDRMNTMKLRGHKVIMYTADSIIYTLAEPFNLPLSDTSKIKDSLNRFYYSGKAKVELN